MAGKLPWGMWGLSRDGTGKMACRLHLCSRWAQPLKPCPVLSWDLGRVLQVCNSFYPCVSDSHLNKKISFLWGFGEVEFNRELVMLSERKKTISYMEMPRTPSSSPTIEKNTPFPAHVSVLLLLLLLLVCLVLFVCWPYTQAHHHPIQWLRKRPRKAVILATAILAILNSVCRHRGVILPLLQEGFPHYLGVALSEEPWLCGLWSAMAGSSCLQKGADNYTDLTVWRGLS